MQLNDLLIKFSNYGKVRLFQYSSGDFTVMLELNSTMLGLTAELQGRGKTPIEAASELDGRLEIVFKMNNLDDNMSPGNRFLCIS